MDNGVGTDDGSGGLGRGGKKVGYSNNICNKFFFKSIEVQGEFGRNITIYKIEIFQNNSLTALVALTMHWGYNDKCSELRSCISSEQCSLSDSSSLKGNTNNCLGLL